MLPPIAGSFLLHPEEGFTEVKNKKSRRFDLAGQSSPRELDWTNAEGFHRGHPDGLLFEFSYTDFLEQFRNSRKRQGLDDLVPYQMRHSGVSMDLHSKFRSLLQEARKAATSVSGTLRETRKTASHCQSVLPAPHCISQICTRPLRELHLESHQDRSLAPVRMKGQYSVHLFSGGNGMGRGVGLVPGEPGRHPSLPATCFRKWQLETFCVSSSLHHLFFELEHRHTAQFFE